MRYFKLLDYTTALDGQHSFVHVMYWMARPDFIFCTNNVQDGNIGLLNGYDVDPQGFYEVFPTEDEFIITYFHTSLQTDVTVDTRLLGSTIVVGSPDEGTYTCSALEYRPDEHVTTPVIAPDPTKFYYKFKDSVINGRSNSHTTWNDEHAMDYLLHPEFVIVMDSMIVGSDIRIHGWYVSTEDLVLTTTPVLTPIRYKNVTNEEVLLDITDESLLGNTNGRLNTTFAGIRLRDLRVPDDIVCLNTDATPEYIYKLKQSVLENRSSISTGLNDDMSYMFHPDFRFILKNPLTPGDSFTYAGGYGVNEVDVEVSTIASENLKYIDTETGATHSITLHDIAERGFPFSTESLEAYGETVTRPPKKKPAPSWGPHKEYSVSFYDNYLKDQVRTRYAFFERPRDGKKNIIIDSLFPRLMYNHGFSKAVNLHAMRSDIPKTAVAISPFAASVLNVQQIGIEQLCLVLGYTKTQIAKLCRETKKKNLDFVFVGAGGTNINTAHWLTEMCKMSNVPGVFKTVSVFEEDEAELSNLLRFPKDPTLIRNTVENGVHKLNIIADDAFMLSRAAPQFIAEYIPNSQGHYPSEVYKSTTTRDAATGSIVQENITLRRPESTILYGAPSIETRDAMSQHGNFICATHADASCSMWLNPNQGDDLNIQIESYGMIQLGTFFVNQLKMAITLMEMLTNDSLVLSQQDVELLDYSFDGTIQGATDRIYNWQVLESTGMMTEEQAQDITF